MNSVPSRRQFIAGSGILVAGLAAGCRSSSAPGPQPDATNTGPSQVQPTGSLGPELIPNPKPEDLVGGPQWTPPDLAGKSLTLWGLNYAPHVQRYKALAVKFNELTGAKVNVQPQDNIERQMLTAIAGNNAPDVVCLMGRMSGQLVKQKALLDLKDDVYGALQIDMEKWWFPDAIQSYTWGDAIYGVPTEPGTSGYAVTGRTDLVSKASPEAQSLWPGSVDEADWPTRGVAFKSYDELFSLGKELQQGSGKSKVWGVNRQGWEMQSLSSLMLQQDTLFWNEESGEYNLDNEACVKGLDTMITTPYKMGIESNLAVGNIGNSYLAKQVALAIGASGIAGQAALVHVPAEGVIAPPMVEGTENPLFMSEGGWGFEIPAKAKNAKNRDTALEFVKFMTTYEAQFIYAQIYGGLQPACRALSSSEVYAGDDAIGRGLRRIIQVAPNLRFDGHGRDPQSEDIVMEIMTSVRTGKTTSREASKMLQKNLTAQQKRF